MRRPPAQNPAPSGGQKAATKPSPTPLVASPQPQSMVAPTFFTAAGNRAANTLANDDAELFSAVAAKGRSFATFGSGFGTGARDRSQPTTGLVFAETKQPVPAEGLVNWAVKQGGTPQELYPSLLNSYDFLGSKDKRRTAANTLAVYMEDVQLAIQHDRDVKRKERDADY